MSSLSYKPLRKSVHLTQISDEEIRWKLQNRASAGRYFSGKKIPGNNQLSEVLSSSVMVPAARGKIADILFTVPGYYDQKNPDVLVDPLDTSHFTTLIGHLCRSPRKYTVLCHASQEESIRKWFRDAGVPETDFTISISVFNYSIWAQDAYIALNDHAGHVVLAESICFTRDHDMTVADDLALQTDVLAQPSFLYFQGGNVLETRDLVLVGMDYVRENEGRPFMETREKVLKEFGALCKKKVLAVGREEIILHRDRQYLGGGIFQPIFHIDMYITPTGLSGSRDREILMVGSPRLAREILGEQANEHDFDKYFDEVAEQLSLHYEVRRMPLLPTQFRSKDSEWPRHYYLSYNNVLVENYLENKKVRRYVYLPTYAGQVETFRNEKYITAYYGSREKYASLDKAAKKIWSDLGFEVRQMDALEDLAMSWGSVHCMVKTLRRSDPA
jgi:hypothetical protein